MLWGFPTLSLLELFCPLPACIIFNFNWWKPIKKINKYIHKPQLEVQRKETDWWDDGHTSLTGGPVTRKHFPAPAAIFFLLSVSCLLLPPKALLSLFFEHTSVYRVGLSESNILSINKSSKKLSVYYNNNDSLYPSVVTSL